MSEYVSIQIPKEVLSAAWISPEQLKLELAITLYQQGKLSFGKAREMAGISFRAFQQTLGSREIPVHYDEDDYQQDKKTLKDLGLL